MLCQIHHRTCLSSVDKFIPVIFPLHDLEWPASKAISDLRNIGPCLIWDKLGNLRPSLARQSACFSVPSPSLRCVQVEWVEDAPPECLFCFATHRVYPLAKRPRYLCDDLGASTLFLHVFRLHTTPRLTGDRLLSTTSALRGHCVSHEGSSLLIIHCTTKTTYQVVWTVDFDRRLRLFDKISVKITSIDRLWDVRRTVLSPLYLR